MTIARTATTAAYAVQGTGFAVVLTSIPGYKDRLGMGDDVVTLVVLGVCVCAGLGSALSGAVSARRGSRAVVVGGLLLAAIGIAGAGAAPTWPLFFAALGAYGLALGSVDAAMNMQGIDVERAYGRSLLASFYAGNAAGGVLGALVVSGAALVGLGQAVALPLVAVLVAIAALVLGPRLVPVRGVPDDARAVDPPTDPGAGHGRSVDRSPAQPGAAAVRVAAGTVALLGLAMVAFPVADSAVSSWSATFLRDVLAASAAAAPLGYAAYQAALIVSRLAGDGLVERLGRVRVVRLGGLLGVVGFAVVALAPGWPVAVVGLALTGLGLGVVAPLAFSAAGDRAREVVAAARTGRAGVDQDGLVETVTDRAVARLNVFTYVGAVLGGVLTGVFATAQHLRVGFVVLAALAAVSAVLAGRFRAVRPDAAWLGEDAVVDGEVPDVGADLDVSGGTDAR
ncbi:MFS transporter [Cellulosimicrobium arenosum]|uniref:MFS transporter n=1 Tax=Cellulosimicrobium arenosum TaxID=2708133 RepID=A0A927G7B2_9MICO|nr:MFS transporter [Cellulosimicrobium arenosum]